MIPSPCKFAPSSRIPSQICLPLASLPLAIISLVCLASKRLRLLGKRRVSRVSRFSRSPRSDHSFASQTTVVLGFHNDGKEPYNVSAIFGSLNSPTDFSIFVQNFTQQIYHQAVAPGKELSIEYKFMPDPRVEPRDFIVSLTVFYQDTKGVYFSNTFFNQTIEIVEVKKLIDWELIFLYVFLIALVGVIGYLAYSYAAPHLQSMGYISKKSKKTKKVATGPKVQTEEEAEDWLKGTNYAAFTQAKDAKKKVVPKEKPVAEEKKKPAVKKTAK